MFDHHDPDYSADRIYEAADRMVKERKENPRYICPIGCGADFATRDAREVHIICDHEGEAA